MGLVHSVHLFRGFKIAKSDVLESVLKTSKYECPYDLAYAWAKEHMPEFVGKATDYFEAESALPFRVIVYEVAVGKKIFYVAASGTYQEISQEESVDVTEKIEGIKAFRGQPDIDRYKMWCFGLLYARKFYEYLSGRNEEQSCEQYQWHLVWTAH